MANHDPYPNIDEHGPGSCKTPGGMAIGCAVCTAGDILVRYNKSIPRLSNGTPDMRTLGNRMGVRCRRVNGTQHGLALFTNDHMGKKWATCCIYLELRANGLSARHATFSKAQIAGFLKAGKPLAVPGTYGKVPKVATSSYSSTVPARGRSDSYLGGHMVAAYRATSIASDGSIRQVAIGDSDFGSPSRPVVPPHSSWSASTFWAYQQSLANWKIVVVDTPLPSLTSGTSPLTVTVTCDTIARRGAAISSDKLGSLPKGAKLSVVATSEGSSWSGCGKSGTKWRKFTHVNGKSTMSKWGRAYAYCAAGLTKAV